MGLDMYLYRKHYIGNSWKDPADQLKVSACGGEGAYIKNERIHEITEKVAYWRKANAIHKWFVDNVQGGEDDCKQYYVEKKQLQELVKLCETVLAGSILVDGKITNGQSYKNGVWLDNIQDGKVVETSTTAQILLPTQGGFFFGGTDYDQWYVESLKDTVEQLTAVLEEPEVASFCYQSSW